jgi:hypothetical protein
MVKPVRRRRTFGGKEGIWWRKRTLPPIASETNESPSSSDPKPENNVEQQPRTSTTAMEDSATSTSTTTTTVGWDHDLCRPTFHRNMVSDECQDDSTSCEDETSSGDTFIKETTEQPKDEKAAPITIAPPAKRSKTFGCRSRRPLSLLLLDANCLEYSPSSPASSSPDKKKIRAEAPSPTSLLLSSPTYTGTSTSTPSSSHIMSADPELPRRVSTSPGGLVRSGEKPRHTEKASSTPTSSTSSSKEDTASEPSPFNFEDEQQQVVVAQRPDTPPSKKDPKRPSASSSLLQAKEYFDNLDSTTRLTLDSYDSPVVSSRVVRTSRKVSLSSPGITREYKAYAEASTESGVSPLSRKDYARSRRDFFRNAELFDGFLDS